MGNQLVKPVSASELARHLELIFAGEDCEFDRVLPLDKAQSGGMSFSKLAIDSHFPSGFVLIAPESACIGQATHLISQSPRLDFARALCIIARTPGFHAPTDDPNIHPSVVFGSNIVLGKGVTIGAETVVGNNVVIGEGVKIGARCHIKSNTVIGEDGFGFERDGAGLPIRLVHLGAVVIGDDVEIGSLNTICRGTLKDTVVESHVKTDDHVHIAHNCHIGRGALITACTEISGGVEIGQFVWIGPNSSIINQASIGNHAFVGIGSNVTKSVDANDVVAGNPARSLRRGAKSS